MSGLLEGRKGLILGVANKRSVAWSCAQALKREGMDLALTYVNERFERPVKQLAEVDAFPPEFQGWRLCKSPREAAAAAAEAKAQDRFFEAANMSSVLGAAEQWLAVARPGVCAATTGPGDCEHGAMGSFKDAGLDQVRTWDQLARRCKWLCEGCARCRHISASLAFKDCSWFQDCSLDALSSAAPGFKSAPVDARSLEHLQKLSA